MIFDDHDIRDDWNTSWTGTARSTRDPVVARADRRAGSRPTGSTSTSATSRRRELARERSGRGARARGRGSRRRRARPHARCRRARRPRRRGTPRPTAGATPATSATSRLVVVDSRAARVLAPDGRSMLDADEMGWLDGVAARRRSTTCSSGPPCRSCCPRACTTSRRSTRRWPGGLRPHGRRRAGPRSCAAASTSSTGRPSRRASPRCSPWSWRWRAGERGPAPQTITFLSGDVHNSYVAEVDDPLRAGRAVAHPPGRLLADPQPAAAPGSHRRCPLFAQGRWFARCGSSRRALREVPDPAYHWTVTDGPWFDNNLALLSVRPATSTCAGSPVSSRTTRSPTAPAGVCRAARPLPAAAGLRVGSGTVQGLTTTAEHRGRRLALGGQESMRDIPA